MRRHLPLLGLAPASISGSDSSPTDEPSRARVQLVAASVGIADTGDGLAAAQFAVALTAEMRAIGSATAIVLLGFEGVPALPASLQRELAASSTSVASYLVSPQQLELPAGSAPPAACVSLWVGVPAVTRFRPALSVLLGADRAITGWPAALRGARGSFQLELAQNRVGLAEALAAALNGCGFLPRR